MRFFKKIQSVIHKLTADAEVDAMTFERKKALEKLDGLQIAIAKHLFMLSQYPDQDLYTKGWTKELRAWNATLRAANRGKKGQKNFSRPILWNAIWEEPLGEPGDRVEIAAQVAAEKSELQLIEKPDVASIKEMAKKFVDAVLDPKPGTIFTP